AKSSGPRRNAVQTVLNARTIANQLVAEIDGALTGAQADELARRHGLTRIGSQNFPLVGATIGLFRITDGRAADTVRRELAAGALDALGAKEGPHLHGTGIAGAIASHSRLMGSAPAGRILAIRAFGVASGVAESNSYVILKALDYAVAHGAQIVNMSFAGPKD